MAVLTLTEDRHEAFAKLANDLRRIFGDRFSALVAYAPRRSAAFAASIGVADLAAAARLADGWSRLDLEVPLLLTPEEFRHSLDAFPVEYGAILRRHIVIAGAPPFDGASVASGDVRRALIVASIDPFRAILANAAQLAGAAADTDEELASFGAAHLDLAADTIRGLLVLDDGVDFDPSAVMPVYLDAAERLWRALDRFGGKN